MTVADESTTVALTAALASAGIAGDLLARAAEVERMAAVGVWLVELLTVHNMVLAEVLALANTKVVPAAMVVGIGAEVRERVELGGGA